MQLECNHLPKTYKHITWEVKVKSNKKGFVLRSIWWQGFSVWDLLMAGSKFKVAIRLLSTNTNASLSEEQFNGAVHLPFLFLEITCSNSHRHHSLPAKLIQPNNTVLPECKKTHIHVLTKYCSGQAKCYVFFICTKSSKWIVQLH